ncbi:putative transcriptional regulator [Acidianus rod-shaped virus 1]|uniref:Putative transcriptional regulator n=1 Tax=Acidianus rod-shaped virus 1 TaxID=309181 RepID=Q50I33_9VIRU|nr:putative transcriptional regulator [Acidianus rod-shaped virus 1]CAI44193.1 putative transcriptional regulator [Acidianus rod-shaped virus 1]
MEMSMEEIKGKAKLGKKEKEVLEYLTQGDTWVEHLYRDFCWAHNYMPYFGRVLKRLEQKGWIAYYHIRNDDTGRRRKYVCLTPEGLAILNKRVSKAKQ